MSEGAMWRATHLGCALLMAFAASVSAHAQPAAGDPAPWRRTDAEGWSLQWPGNLTRIPYLGVVRHDGIGLGPGGGMLYPAPNIGGFIAAVLAHALVNEGAKSALRATIQTEADKVLDDYRATIDSYEPADLMRRVGAAMALASVAPRAPGQARRIVEVQPVFWMTQDRRALIVDNELVVMESSEGPVLRRSAVRVVGSPLPEADARQRWSDGDGERLRSESAALLAQAIQMSLHDLEGLWAKDAGYRTVRFPEGGSERIERAQMLMARCGRAVIRNLRGDLMGVPLALAASAEGADVNCLAPGVPQ